MHGVPNDLSIRVSMLEAALRAMDDRLRRLEGRAPAPAAEVISPTAPSAAPQIRQIKRPAGPSGRAPAAVPRLSAELEVAIGTSWLNRLGIIAIIAAVAYFLKYSFDNQWIGPTGRVVLTWLLGLALIGAGERYRRRRLVVFAQGLAGGGTAVLYFAVYAAFAIYHLVGWPLAFLMMGLITVATVVLALRYDAMAIAALGLLGGFATPLLLSGPGGAPTGAQPVPVGLYLYFLLLDAGTYIVARRKRWWFFGAMGLAAGFVLPVIIGFGGTPNPSAALVYYLLITLAVLALSMLHGMARLAWAAVGGGFLVSLAGGVSLASTRAPYADLAYFGILSVAAILVAQRRGWRGVGTAAGVAGILLGTVPVVRATDFPAAVAYLAVVNAAMLYAVIRGGWRFSDLAALVATGAAVAWSLPGTPTVGAAAVIAGTGVLFVLFNLTLSWASRELTEQRLLTVLVATALYAAQVAGVLRGEARDPLALAAVILAAYHVVVARVLLRRVPALTVLALLGLALTLLTVAVPLKLRGEAIALAWSVEGAALAWAAARTRNRWAAAGAVIVLAVAVARVVAFETTAIRSAGLVATMPGLAFAAGIAALAAGRSFLRKVPWSAGQERYIPELLGAVAVVLLLYWGSREIDGVFARGGAHLAAAGAKQAALSAWFTLYGFGLVVAGMWKDAPLVRWAGIGLLGITILKVFVVDLAAVAVVFRVLSLAILGALLLLASLAYSRYRGRLTTPSKSGGMRS